MSTPIEYVYVPVPEQDGFEIEDAFVPRLNIWLKKVPITELVGDAVEFGCWYSGMEKEKVVKAYQRWLNEKPDVIVEPKCNGDILGVMKEAVEYLDRVVYQDGQPQYPNKINATSILHRKMKKAIKDFESKQ